MASELLFTPSRATNANNEAISGAKWLFYIAGTTTPQSVYADSALSTSLGSVVTSDSGGNFVPIYMDKTKSYRGDLVSADEGVEYYTADPINGIPSTINPNVSNYDFTTSKTLLAGLSGGEYGTVYLSDGPSSGPFTWDSSDLSTQVALDSLQGIYVAPNSDATGFSGAWVRVWDGINGRPEWFGALINDVAFDCAASIEAAFTLCGDVRLKAGVYYCPNGLTQPTNTSLRGVGFYRSVIGVTSATAHQWQPATNPSYNITLENLSFDRTVNPSEGGSVPLDKGVAHGLHFAGTVNATINYVFTLNNLVDFYFNNTINNRMTYLLGNRVLGDPSDRYYGTWIDGSGSTIGGTSANHSLYLSRIYNYQSGAADVGTAWGLYGEAALSDLFLDYYECANMNVGAFLDLVGEFSAFDVRMHNLVIDRYISAGIHVRNAGKASQIKITDPYLQGADPATPALLVETCYGVHVDGMQITIPATGLGVLIATSQNCKISGQVRGGSGLRSVSSNRCEFNVTTMQPTGSTSGVYGYRFEAGDRNKITANLSGDNNSFGNGIELVSSCSNFHIDATMLDPAAMTGAPVTIEGVAITNQGRVSGHMITSPDLPFST